MSAVTDPKPWVCPHCGHHFPTDELCTLHEPKCPLRPTPAGRIPQTTSPTARKVTGL